MELSERVPQYVIDNVGNIILGVSKTAETRTGKVIECSSVALRGWANAYIQLKDDLTMLQEACRTEGYLPDASDRTHNRICTVLAILWSK